MPSVLPVAHYARGQCLEMGRWPSGVVRRRGHVSVRFHLLWPRTQQCHIADSSAQSGASSIFTLNAFIEYEISDVQVIRLRIERPLDFNFQAGDYIYANIPEVARFEWHPFTISSAPEDEGTINKLG